MMKINKESEKKINELLEKYRVEKRTRRLKKIDAHRAEANRSQCELTR